MLLCPQRKTHLWIPFFFAFLLGSAQALADFSVNVMPSPHAKDLQQIRGLSLEQKAEARESHGTESRFLARVKGSFVAPRRSLLIKDKKIEVKPDGRFDIYIPLTGDSTRVVLRSVDLHGNVETQEVLLLAGSWVNEPRPPRHSASGGLGFTFLNYQETTYSTLTQIALTVKGQYSFVIVPPRWDVALSGYATALPLTSSWQDRNIRFLGANLRVGYTFTPGNSPWRVSLMAGGYYTTTLIQGENFGFTGMAGPQIYPVVHRTLTSNHSVSGYFKFSPILQGVAPTFESNEIAAGGAWTLPFIKGRRISITLDVARLHLNIQNVIYIDSNSATLGVGYQL